MEVKLSELPNDLRKLVLDFAFNVPEAELAEDINTLVVINSWGLPFWFLERAVWSWKMKRYVQTPLKTYTPIRLFGNNYQELFNVDVVWSFLEGLDFRIKKVRSYGSRTVWKTRICNWRAFDALGSFYKMLLRVKGRVLKKACYYKEYYVIGKPCKL